MDEQQFQALVSQHGGVAGNPVAVDPTVSQPNPVDVAAGVANPRQVRGPNPNPSYLYTFKDGTQIKLRRHQNPDGSYANSYEVTGSGGALKPSTSTSQKAPTTRTVNGTTYQFNPQTNKWEPAPGIPTQGEALVTITDSVGNKQQVPVSVANYYATQAERARQAAYQQAQFQWQQTRAHLSDQLSLGKLSLDQATQAATEAHQRISEQLQEQTNAVNYSKMIAPNLFSKAGMANWNGALGKLAQLAGTTYTPETGIPVNLPLQLSQQALAQANPELASTLGLSPEQLPVALGYAQPGPLGPMPLPASAKPAGLAATLPASTTAAAPAAVAPSSAYVAPSTHTTSPSGPGTPYTAPRPLSPTNQLIEAGSGPD